MPLCCPCHQVCCVRTTAVRLILTLYFPLALRSSVPDPLTAIILTLNIEDPFSAHEYMKHAAVEPRISSPPPHPRTFFSTTVRQHRWLHRLHNRAPPASVPTAYTGFDSAASINIPLPARTCVIRYSVYPIGVHAVLPNTTWFASAQVHTVRISTIFIAIPDSPCSAFSPTTRCSTLPFADSGRASSALTNLAPHREHKLHRLLPLCRSVPVVHISPSRYRRAPHALPFLFFPCTAVPSIVCITFKPLRCVASPFSASSPTPPSSSTNRLSVLFCL